MLNKLKPYINNGLKEAVLSPIKTPYYAFKVGRNLELYMGNKLEEASVNDHAKALGSMSGLLGYSAAWAKFLPDILNIPATATLVSFSVGLLSAEIPELGREIAHNLRRLPFPNRE